MDAGAIIRDLILFDTLIVESVRLTEFPTLMKSFGVEGLSALLKSGRLKIHCQSTTIAQTGQSTLFEMRARRGTLPLGSYPFAAIRAGDREKYIHKCLQELHRTDDHLKDVIRLKREAVKALVP